MLKTCAYKIGNRLILKLSLFSKKVIIKKSEYSLKEKRRISKQSEAKLASPPPTGNCDCASVEGGIIGIVYSVENAIVFFKKKKRTVGNIRLCAASLHCPSAFLYSFRLIREAGNPSYRGS